MIRLLIRTTQRVQYLYTFPPPTILKYLAQTKQNKRTERSINLMDFTVINKTKMQMGFYCLNDQRSHN